MGKQMKLQNLDLNCDIDRYLYERCRNACPGLVECIELAEEELKTPHEDLMGLEEVPRPQLIKSIKLLWEEKEEVWKELNYTKIRYYETFFMLMALDAKIDMFINQGVKESWPKHFTHVGVTPNHDSVRPQKSPRPHLRLVKG